jgi:prophage regulatory protein
MNRRSETIRSDSAAGLRLYRFWDLRAAGVPFTRKHITTLERRGEFPMHFPLTEFSVAWVASEVDAWVEQRIRARRPHPEPAPDTRKTKNAA